MKHFIQGLICGMLIMAFVTGLALRSTNNQQPRPREYTGTFTNGVVIDTEYYDANPVPLPCKSVCFTGESSLSLMDSCGRTLNKRTNIAMYPLPNGQIPANNLEGER